MVLFFLISESSFFQGDSQVLQGVERIRHRLLYDGSRLQEEVETRAEAQVQEGREIQQVLLYSP